MEPIGNFRLRQLNLEPLVPSIPLRLCLTGLFTKPDTVLDLKLERQVFTTLPGHKPDIRLIRPRLL